MSSDAQSGPLPDAFHSVEQLEDQLSSPTSHVIESLARLSGDMIVLGVAGKMGPTLIRMVQRADRESGRSRRLVGVARFSNAAEREKLEQWGIETIQADLLDPSAVAQLPDAELVMFMAGMKFGSAGNLPLTWAMNTHVPSIVTQRYRSSRIVAFSTGNVYGMVPVDSGGSVESDTLNPEGEYAMSCLGRERMFEHFCAAQSTPVALIRLNYACELRYGVLVDLAQRVWQGEAIDVSMGYCNVIWQGDANAMAISAFEHCATPARILNSAGPEILSVRKVCEQFAARMNKPLKLVGDEQPTALLSNGQQAYRLCGEPHVTAEQMIDWIADWVMRGGESLGKPTKFEVRDGRF